MLNVFKDENFNLDNPIGLSKSFWLWNPDLLKFNNKKVISYLLKKEKEIINKFPAGADGYTNLPNSLTSRFSFYNFFTYFENGPKEINIIKNFIKKNIKNLLNKFNINKIDDLHIMCWYNVLRKGEEIGEHTHFGIKGLYKSFISGHFCVNAFNTSTFYKNMFNSYNIKIKNEIGQITLFPSHLLHWTDKHEDDEVRISIAFDLYFLKDHVKKEFLDSNVAIHLNLNNF